jgi:hypothetical protein
MSWDEQEEHEERHTGKGESKTYRKELVHVVHRYAPRPIQPQLRNGGEPATRTETGNSIVMAALDVQRARERGRTEQEKEQESEEADTLSGTAKAARKTRAPQDKTEATAHKTHRGAPRGGQDTAATKVRHKGAPQRARQGQTRRAQDIDA